MSPHLPMAALLLLLCGTAAPPSHACGFDGVLPGGFSAMHPRSIGVAFAIRDAIENQEIPNSATEPIAGGAPGYWRAVGRLNDLTAHLSAAAHHTPGVPAISVLFIDSGLWSRISSGPDSLWLVPHTEGPQPSDIVIVTNETVLAEVLAERISIKSALGRAIIAIDGDRKGVQVVHDLLIQALDQPNLFDRRNGPQPTVRFFGPNR